MGVLASYKSLLAQPWFPTSLADVEDKQLGQQCWRTPLAGLCSLPGAGEAPDLGLGRRSRHGVGTVMLHPEPL